MSQPNPQTDPVEIRMLADRPELIPELERCFRLQWPDYFANRTSAEMEEDFRREAHRDVLPVRFVATIGGRLAGTAVLRPHAIDSQPAYAPGIGGLVVAPACRWRGIGTALVRACVDAARGMNFPTVYTATATAIGVFERAGWEYVKVVLHAGQDLVLYRYPIDGDTP
jgi:GNAT superfamily N-acetyltransferase